MKNFKQLSSRQQEELKYFFGTSEYYQLENGKVSLVETVKRLKEAYENARTLLHNEGVSKIKELILKDEGASYSVREGDNLIYLDHPQNPERVRLYKYVCDTELRNPYFNADHPFQGRLHIFRLLEKRGNPAFIPKVETETVVEIADELLERIDWQRYRLRRTGEDVRYSMVLLQDIVKELRKENIHVGIETVRRKLRKVDYYMPEKYMHPLR